MWLRKLVVAALAGALLATLAGAKPAQAHLRSLYRGLVALAPLFVPNPNPPQARPLSPGEQRPFPDFDAGPGDEKHARPPGDCRERRLSDEPRLFEPMPWPVPGSPCP